jgi:hypothetical protein
MTQKTVAIIPKKAQAGATQAALDAYLKEFAADFTGAMAAYPADQPWRSRTPKSGVRANGQRTGTYGAGWANATPHFTKASVTIVNDVPYAVVVGGSRRQSPGQARVLAARGWPSVQDVGPEIAKKHLPKLSKTISTSII